MISAAHRLIVAMAGAVLEKLEWFQIKAVLVASSPRRS
jgi:hypothetical protein